MERITKKAFIDLLKNNKSVFIGAINNKHEDLHEFIENAVKTIEIRESDERRTIKKIQTNAVQFSNDSWLYFDGEGEKTYHKIGNFIYQHTKIDYSKDSSCSWNDIMYSAVVYYVELSK